MMQVNNLEYTNKLIEFEDVLQHPVIRNFCSHPGHQHLVQNYIMDESKMNLEKLNTAFRIYYFAIRFTKYMRTIVTKGRADFVRSTKRKEERELVIYNMPVSEEEEKEIGEMITNIYYGEELPQITVDPRVFQEQIDNEWLYDGFIRLTSKQKFVVTLAYSACSRDSEIALLLHVTQQNVSKTRAAALRKLKCSFPSNFFPNLLIKR
jgi:DNA-directed RNA polymerase specialized sigma24 family protein